MHYGRGAVRVQGRVGHFFVYVVVVFTVCRPVTTLGVFSLFFVGLSATYQPRFLTVRSVTSRWDSNML